MKCYHTHQAYVEGEWICTDCNDLPKGRRPLTDWERQKLSWYRDERKWIDNIRNRRIINGRVFSGNQELPKP